MNKMWKRALALLLAGMLLVGSAPAEGLAEMMDFLSITAAAESKSGVCGKDGANVTWSLDMNTGVLTISGAGAMEDYEGVNPWYDDRLSIRLVTIDNGVTSIGDCAFNACEDLESITIPNGVTNIGDYAFAYCERLTSVTIPNSVTTIGKAAFWICTHLTSVTIPNSVTSIGACA